MKKIKEFSKAFFVFLLPLMILINCCTNFYSEVDFTVSGQSGHTSVSGFPLLETGHFLNGYLSEVDTNWGHVFLNQLLIFAAAYLIYFFLLRKINVESKKKSIVLTVIVTIIYVKFGLITGFYQYNRATSGAGGKWPDKIEVISTHYINPVQYLSVRPY